MNIDDRLGERLRSLSAPTTREQDVVRRLEQRADRRLAGQRLQRLGLVVVVVGLTVAGFIWAASTFGDEPTPASPDPGAILVGRQQVQVFPGGGAGYSEPQAWILAPDGKAQRLDLPGGANSPTWSPDGSHIAFLTRSDEGSFGPAWNLMVADADGSNATAWAEGLPMAPGTVVQWSPDGSSVAVLGARDPTSLSNFDQFGLPFVDIELIRSDGSQEFITQGGTIGSFGLHPSGDMFAAVAYAGEQRQDLITIERDGSERLIAHGAAVSVPPSWSPDGGSILFARTSNPRDGNSSGIESDFWIVSKLGDPLRQLTSDGGLKLAVAWSEGGSRLLYSRATVTSCEVISIAADGTDRRVIADRATLGGCAVSLSLQLRQA